MRYHVLAFPCAAAVIAYVQRLGFNVADWTVRGDLGLDREQVGRVMAAWSLGYALLQLPSGWLADRFGSGPVFTALALAWSALTGLVGLAWDFHSLLVLWFCMGLAQAGIFPCSAKSIGQWFGDSGRASAVGLLASSMALGSAIAPAVTGLLVSHHPWPPGASNSPSQEPCARRPHRPAHPGGCSMLRHVGPMHARFSARSTPCQCSHRLSPPGLTGASGRT
jgi:sugar phosphate permease